MVKRGYWRSQCLELVEELAGWSVPVEYLEAWFEAVQLLEAADLGLDWTVRLVDDQLSQRLQLPHRRAPMS
jgi:outer membrane biogenesis lipoprotein LolB